MKHTKEPWKVINRGDDECSDIDAQGPAGWNSDITIAMNIGHVNANRIVACVNACAGIPTDQLLEARATRDELADIATLEQENRQIRARMQRLEQELAEFKDDGPVFVERRLT